MIPQANLDSKYIQNMFSRLAFRYDLFNHLTSLGMATHWRKETLKPLKAGMRVLDLGCGTGDLALGAIQKIGGFGEVVGLDFSQAMLDVANERYKTLLRRGTGSACRVGAHGRAPLRNGRPNLRWVMGKAEDIPFEPEPYDLVVSGFVLRNLYENIDAILTGVYQALKPSGEISFVDITEPDNALIRSLWRCYMNTIVAFYGRILFGRDYPRLYLTESAKHFFRSGAFVQKLKQKGFRGVHARPLMLGVVTLYQAVK